MSTAVTLTARDAERCFQALSKEADRLAGLGFTDDAAASLNLALRMTEVAAVARAAESDRCNVCGHQRGSLSALFACGLPIHADLCAACDVGLDHSTSDPRFDPARKEAR